MQIWLILAVVGTAPIHVGNFPDMDTCQAAAMSNPIAVQRNEIAEGDCDVESSSLGNWRRTRRNVLAAGGLLAGAMLLQLGASKANAGIPGAAGDGRISDRR